MPIYEFACEGCGARFEELVWSSEEIAGVVCPHCGSQHIKRKMSAFAAIGGGRAATGGDRPRPGGGSCATGGG